MDGENRREMGREGVEYCKGRRKEDAQSIVGREGKE